MSAIQIGVYKSPITKRNIALLAILIRVLLSFILSLFLTIFS